MTVLYHPEFAGDIRNYAARYATVSPRLETRFRNEVDAAIAAVLSHPTGAGHFVHTGSVILREVRRRNLEAFPFFVLYGLTDDRLIFGSLIPSASDPLTWLDRFSSWIPQKTVTRIAQITANERDGDIFVPITPHLQSESGYLARSFSFVQFRVIRVSNCVF